MIKGVSWVAIVVAVVLLEGLGMLWYGPLFGRAWTAAMPFQPDMAGQGPKMAIGVVNTLVLVLGLAWLLGRTGATSLAGALGVSLAAWFAFSFTTQALEYLYMGLSAPFVAINMGYLLVAFLLAGAVLALLKIGARATTTVAA